MLHITYWGQINTVPDPHIQAFLLERQALLTDYDLEREVGFLIVESMEYNFSFVGSNGLS